MALDTVENIINFYRLFKKIQNIFLITSDFHMKRSLMCLKVLFPRVNSSISGENRITSEKEAIVRDLARVRNYKK